VSKFGRELLESAGQALEIARGKKRAALRVEVTEVDVAAVRKQLKLSQSQFAKTFDLSAATVRDWEQGRRRPDRTARALLKVIARKPEAAMAALSDRGSSKRRRSA
jgi:putative transcriptional regulator